MMNAETSRVATRRMATPDGEMRELLIDQAESPLAWLASRRDKSGEAMISAMEFTAGERFRADYTLGGLVARTTMNWDGFALGGGGGKGGPGGGLIVTEAAMAARDRVTAAIDAVGPELASVLIDVCCHLKGLGDVEKAQQWPLRSGKVVLRLGLQALARHYGLDREARGPAKAGVRHWGDKDYKPAI